MNRFFTDIAANDALKAQLGEDIASSKLSHAYIIEGPHGSGKHTLAYRIAAALCCDRKNDPSSTLPCMRCPSCKKIVEKKSTDVIIISREERATLGVDVIRRLKSDILVPPNDTTLKLYIIEDAHLMTPQAQNAFLLSLEEPPQYVLFLLLCESTAPLLETVRSRAPTLHTEPVETSLMDEYLCRHSEEARALKASNQHEYHEILTTANGCIGTALSLLSPSRRKPILEKRERARTFVRLCTERQNTSAALRYLSMFGKSKRDAITEQLNLILICLRDLLLCKQTDDPVLCFFSEAEEAHALAYHFTTPEILRLCNAVSDSVDRLNANANVRLTLTALAVNAGMIQL